MPVLILAAVPLGVAVAQNPFDGLLTVELRAETP